MLKLESGIFCSDMTMQLLQLLFEHSIHVHTHTHVHTLQISLSVVSGKVLAVLLKYLYTGECVYPSDDLDMGVEVCECEHTHTPTHTQTLTLAVSGCGCLPVGETEGKV